ncbi:MAG: EAL domain-containing protein [Gammaproteobacteria bacterium]
MATVAAWWRRWTEPAADVADPVDRRQARLLAGVVLFILALGSTSIVLQLILTPDFWPVFLVVLGAMVVLLGGYHLARRGRYAAGTLVTCTVLAAVRDLVSDPNDASIVSATIAMAQSLNLEVIGEGVETQEQLAALRELGCREVQGYHLSRPVSQHDIASLLQSPFVH